MKRGKMNEKIQELNLNNLTKNELEQIKKVIEKQIEFENELEQSIGGLKKTMSYLIRTQANDELTKKPQLNGGKTPANSPSLLNQTTKQNSCFLCSRPVTPNTPESSIIEKFNFLKFNNFHNKFDLNNGMRCIDCYKFVCDRCGNMTSPDFINSSPSNTSTSLKWRCKICIVKRELAKKSGCWSLNLETQQQDPCRCLYETLKSITEKQNENQIEFNDFKRLKIKKYGLVATAASKFHSNLKRSDSPEGFRPVNEDNKNITLDQWRQKRQDKREFEEDDTSITKKNFREFSSCKQKSVNNEIKLSTKDLNEIIQQTQPDENLANLAKVILIEHRKSIKMCQTVTQDSSISYNQSTDSWRESLSSRQDSSISMNENDRPVGRERFIRYSLESQRNSLRNSLEWHQRRKGLMVRAKKWSNAFDEANRDDSSNIATTDESFASNSFIEAQDSFNNSPINEDESVHTENNHQSILKSSYNEDIFNDQIVNNRKSSRKLPEVPKNSQNIPQQIQNKIIINNMEIIKNNDNENEIDDNNNENIVFTTSNTSISSHKSIVEKTPSSPNKRIRKRGRIKSLKTNSNDGEAKNNFSRSIDSIDSLNRSQKKAELAKLATKSVDFSKLADKKNSNQIFVNSILTQRSIDYPCIVRKAPKLSDIVRKRLLFQKVSRGATLLGESFSNSVEKEHVPKTPRKIIIRQDNSIEISLSRPSKLRRQTFSEDITNNNYYTQQFNNSNLLPDPNSNKQTSSQLSVSSNNDRRKTIETCENIFIQSEESTKLRARTPPSNPHRILLYKDKSDKSIRTIGLGMIIIGGYECEDGSLGCFVTFVIKGGPADLNSIEVGDQILEFNGHSLIDSTYDEVRTYLNYSGDVIQLVVHHNNIRLKIGPTTSPLEVSRHFETVPRLCPSQSRKRRNLPPLPTTNMHQPRQESQSFKNDHDYIVAETLQVPAGNNLLKPILINHGRLLMQLWHNCGEFKLAITINQVTNLPTRSADEQWYTFVNGRVIFDDQDTKLFSTKATLSGVWNETFVFEYEDAIEEATLEICIHDTQIPDDTRPLRENFIGMIILPLSEANLEDEPRWYELRDKPTRKTSTASVTFKSSSNESQESFDEMKKKKFSFISQRMSRKSALSHKRSSKNINSDCESSPSPSTSPKINSVRRISRAFAKLLSFRRNSESAIKKNIIQFESEDEEISNEESLQAGKVTRNSHRRHTELLTSNTLTLPSPGSRKTSNASSRKSSVNDIDEDIDSYFSSETKCPSTPGLGQVIPKPEFKEDVITGDIKLGFLMSKGQLEITIFEARNLIKLDGSSKDTYVKTYLRTGTNRIQKKKTQVVKNTTEPVFNTKLSYSACNVLGRRIQVVMIWQKAPKLDKNHCIGEAFIQLDQLELAQQTIGWYKLYKQHVVDSDFYDST